MSVIVIILGVLAFVAGIGYLAGCAGAQRWLTLREWWGGKPHAD